jgi:outer membrane protein assembly factor BamE (lipoprotein component of BamABCDE complex)
MLRKLKISPVKTLCLVACAALVIFWIVTQTAKTTFRNLSSKEIDLLIVKGMTSESVARILGTPEATDPKLWHYRNAARSRKTSDTYIPAAFGVRFSDSDTVEGVIRGPVP